MMQTLLTNLEKGKKLLCVFTPWTEEVNCTHMRRSGRLLEPLKYVQFMSFVLRSSVDFEVMNLLHSEISHKVQ